MVTPQGETIRVPAFAFQSLRRMGLLLGNSNRLSPRVYQFLDASLDAITTAALRRLLGADLSGPEWVLCTCKDCQRRAAESDRTALPGRNPLDDARAEEIVKEVVAKRKY